MPAKYSHVKKRPTRPRKTGAGASTCTTERDGTRGAPGASPHADRGLSRTLSAVSELEAVIARMLLLRFEHDIARLFATHLFSAALLHLPTFVMRCVSVGGAGWAAANAAAEPVKDFFRAVIAMELRQAGERVATKSVLWSYTALRHFALSNGVRVCRTRGLHSLDLLPFFPLIQAHLATLATLPAPAFAKPPHLGPLTEGLLALEDACESKFGTASGEPWRAQVRGGYERTAQTLWRVAREFDVRGYGLVLREKLERRWCFCGCATDHLGEVCERTVREDEEDARRERDGAAGGKGREDGPGHGAKGKEREWDGRGSGVYGWETEEEEDVWELDMDFGQGGPDSSADADGLDADERGMTIGQLMDWRFFKAEREKELGNAAFRRADFDAAIVHYTRAHAIEPELPHYQLNLAAAHLKLTNWMEAEKACNGALKQHRSAKAHFRRAKALKGQGRVDEAVKDLRAALRLQPHNADASAELLVLVPPPEPPSDVSSSSPSSTSSSSTSSSSLPSPSLSSSTSSSSSSSSSTSSSSRTSASSSSSSSSKLASVPPSIATSSSTAPSATAPRAPSFSRTAADDRRLRFDFVPMTVDMPSDGADSPKGASARRTTEAKSFVYPSWERYTVRRA